MRLQSPMQNPDKQRGAQGPALRKASFQRSIRGFQERRRRRAADFFLGEGDLFFGGV